MATVKIEPGMESMVDVYIYETTQLLEQLDEILLRTEQANTFTDNDINEIFRIMHTVKGSSAMMGFENLQQLSHKGEDMFFIIRENPDKMQDIAFVYDLVFRMSDLFKAEIEKIQNVPDAELTDFSDIISELEKGAATLKGDVDAGIAGEKADKAKKDAEGNAAAIANASSNTTVDGALSVRVFFQEGCKMENLRSFLLLNKIREEAEVIDFVPKNVDTDSSTAEVIINDGFLVTFKAQNNETVLRLIENAVNVESFDIIDTAFVAPTHSEENTKAAPKSDIAKPSTAVAAKSESAPAPSQHISGGNADKSSAPPPEASNVSAPGKQSIISVNLAKLDQLHDIVGEIITTESMVISNPELDGLKLESFLKSARELKKLTGELQDTVMSIRMVPLAGPFQKMNRIVRDMKVKLGKDAELKIEGETTEVDKSIVDNLNDPLMHLVRNCMDHGIEDSVQERLDAGKPAKGTVTLAATSSSGEVIITVSDDGGGIDTEKVLHKCEYQGLLTKPAGEYTEREIQNMILLPGFSTNDVVTEYSGRGVGMDVVKQNIEKCGGTLTVDSKHHQGTTFTIKIPLTLAIIEGMEIQVFDTTLTVPISCIRESFKVKNSEIFRDTTHGEMIMIRGECHPILRLHEKFQIPTEITDFEDGILILVETDVRSVCLFADRLIGEQQVVVKPFPAYLSRYNIKGAGLSGCTIMGDGSISLILDVANLMDGSF
ncbi:MAG: chemotaxis protein CheA [Oscillospiraceae bacterium]|jgi:two-component system chemotaxis sensor kinase CheA|nr:chemotaxis protein CheA [Oscillospiraceae bacterium]